MNLTFKNKLTSLASPAHTNWYTIHQGFLFHFVLTDLLKVIGTDTARLRQKPTLWALDVSRLLTLSRPCCIAVKTALSLVSMIWDTLVQGDPSCSIARCACGANTSVGSPVSALMIVWMKESWLRGGSTGWMLQTPTVHQGQGHKAKIWPECCIFLAPKNTSNLYYIWYKRKSLW